ncbi:hypothetical protein GA0074692_0572 [Micromonospora pallida]|uniref:Uncharacterized protein n=1 Tax=Micromonospora pallida TaxID=145854 RepID=A0A1C6RQ58_9ACTN|nr:hypothetical protein [Micromonospora pallida]SCL19207.1 hypothetical protein GA0074692_0572 [Micromonospora pallida]
MRITPGDLLRVDGCASVQFGGKRALTLRVVAVLLDRPTFDGWIWLAGYVLDAKGLATDRRELFVQLAGLYRLAVAAAPAPCAPRRRPTVRANS